MTPQPLAIVENWGEVWAALGGLAAFCAISAFIGSWFGRQVKEQAMVAKTRADLDNHLEWAKKKEELFIDKITTMQMQSIRNGEQIASLADHLHEIGETVKVTARSVNTLEGVVSTVFRSGARTLEGGA